MKTDWQKLWQHIMGQFECDLKSVHGPEHWRRVERNGLVLATRTGAVVEVVRLFAVFHDSRREHDGSDNTHGARGAAFATRLRGTWFDLPEEHFKLLHYACTWHTHGQLSNDPTIGTCWDADRLDLDRVCITPKPDFMSTDFGKEIARNDSLQKFIGKVKLR
jgi:uncharacterized protein